jgi:hypothetical protein
LHENGEQDAGPNDEERGEPKRPVRASLARSSSSVSFAFGARFDWHMKVRVIVGLAVAAQEKHSQQMRRAVSVFTHDESSTEVSHLPDDPNSLIAVFTIPTAAQSDVLDRISQDLWNCIDDVTGPVVAATSGSLDGRTSRWSERE